MSTRGGAAHRPQLRSKGATNLQNVSRIPRNKVDSLAVITIEAIQKAANLPIYITEFDLSYDNNPQKPYPGSKIDPTLPFKSLLGDFPNWFEYQAFAYKHFYNQLTIKGFVEGLTFWGFTDKDWPDWERPGVGFFDKNFQPKLTL